MGRVIKEVRTAGIEGSTHRIRKKCAASLQKCAESLKKYALSELKEVLTEFERSVQRHCRRAQCH